VADYSEVEISRANPACIVFLLDQSQSMADPFGGQGGGLKGEQVATIMNRLIYDLGVECAPDEQGIRDWYHIGVIGYGKTVGPALRGELPKKWDIDQQPLVPISVLEESATVETREVEDVNEAGEPFKRKQKFAKWIDTTCENGTPMCAAIRFAQRVIEPWANTHLRSYPPIVINITDGEVNDLEGEPQRHVKLAAELQQIATVGPLLLFNLHLSSKPSNPIIFPDDAVQLPDHFAEELFAMSSVLPDDMRTKAEAQGYQVRPGSRGFVFNANAIDVYKFLRAGTRLR